MVRGGNPAVLFSVRGAVLGMGKVVSGKCEEAVNEGFETSRPAPSLSHLTSPRWLTKLVVLGGVMCLASQLED